MSDIAELRSEAARTPMHGVWAKGGPVFSHLSDETVHALEGRTIASFGDAATLGMWSFATGAWITGLFQSDLLPTEQISLLFPVLLVYAGLVQFVAGLLLFRRNNSYLATVACSFGAFNLTRSVLLLAQNRGIVPPGGVGFVLEGCLMESFAYIALSLFIGTLRENVVAVLILICTFTGFALGGLPFLTNQTSSEVWAHAGHIGGYFLFGSGFFAYYGGTALLVNTAWRRIVLPIGGQA